MTKVKKEKSTSASATSQSGPLTSKNAQSKLPAPPSFPYSKTAKREHAVQRQRRLRVDKDGAVNWNKVDILPDILKLEDVEQRPDPKEATRQLIAEIKRKEHESSGRDRDSKKADLARRDNTANMAITDEDVGLQAGNTVNKVSEAQAPLAPRMKVKRRKRDSIFTKKRNQK